MKKLFILLLLFLLTGCSTKHDKLLIATTTSLDNSGLLDYLLPHFEEEYDVDVNVVSVGTGKALEMGRTGEVDVLLVHAKDDEIKFIDEGYGKTRYDVMYNQFLLVGPQAETWDSIYDLFDDIINSELTFVSRGDNSGTHKKELKLWNSFNVQDKGSWYIETGKGMGDTLLMTSEMQGITLVDEATYYAMKENIELNIIVPGYQELLLNEYGVITVNPELNNSINNETAELFAKWLIESETQALIVSYEKENRQLFNIY